MTLNVISNYAANVAHRYLVQSDSDASQSLAKLSSGQRIVTARDDAAGLAIGSRLVAQLNALTQCSTNATQASSMLQVADGALSKIGDLLNRMKTLAVQASSGQLGNTERSMIDTEYQDLLSEIDRISNDTSFNGVTLLAGIPAVATSLNTQGTTGGTDYIDAAHGFDSIVFNPTTSGVWQFTYDHTNNVLTAKNVATGQTEGIALSFNSIPVGSTKIVTFANSGVTVTLNSAFNFGADISPSGANAFTSDTAGSIDATSIKITAENTDAVAAFTDATVSIDSAAGGNTLSITTANGTATNATTEDLTAVGTHTVVLADSAGASVTVSFVVTAAFTTDDAAATFTVADLGTTALGTSQTSSTTVSYRIGPGNNPTNDSITVTLPQITTTALGLLTGGGGDVLSIPHANQASINVDAAIDTLNVARAGVGAAQNRLNFASSNLATTVENVDAARSSLLDLDIAAEMTTFTSKQILEQTGIAMLAQANQLPQHLLRLFQ